MAKGALSSPENRQPVFALSSPAEGQVVEIQNCGGGSSRERSLTVDLIPAKMITM
jgi:hypothetical protein